MVCVNMWLCMSMSVHVRACMCVGGVRGRPIFDCERNKPTVVFNPRRVGAIGEFYEIG